MRNGPHSKKNNSIVSSKKELPTLWHHYAKEGNTKGIHQLRQSNNTNRNTKNYQGKTPLHLAVYYNHFETMVALLHSHVDINALDNSQRTPVEIAIHEGHHDIARFLFNCNAKFASELPRTSIPGEDKEESTIDVITPDMNIVLIEDSEESEINIMDNKKTSNKRKALKPIEDDKSMTLQFESKKKCKITYTDEKPSCASYQRGETFAKNTFEICMHYLLQNELSYGFLDKSIYSESGFHNMIKSQNETHEFISGAQEKYRTLIIELFGERPNNNCKL